MLLFVYFFIFVHVVSSGFFLCVFCVCVCVVFVCLFVCFLFVSLFLCLIIAFSGVGMVVGVFVLFCFVFSYGLFGVL